MATIDYSKWEYLDTSSESESEEDLFDAFRSEVAGKCTCGGGKSEEEEMEEEIPVTLPFDPTSTLTEAIGQKPTGKKPRGKPEYVIVHPNDDLSTLDPAFFVHPDKHKPKPNSDGLLECWGLPEASIQNYTRQMQTQFLYRGDSPELQFVKRLIENKRKVLEKRSKELTTRDYVLKISFTNIEPQIWRRFKVSGGISLFTLQDKVLTPVLGWVRNYHGYCFFDHTDGAVFGPTDCGYIDVMHKMNFGYEFYDASQVQLGVLLQNVGDTLGYIYDLGDRWAHEIVVEKILSESESDGRCRCIDGAMRCPPEDSNGCDGMGNHAYQDLLDLLPKENQWRSKSVLNGLRKATKEKIMSASNAMNVKSFFHPYDFHVGKVNAALKKAFHSNISNPSGSKMFHFPIASRGEDRFDKLLRNRHRAGEKVVQKPTCSGAYMQETVNRTRDKKELALCATCGNPNNIHLCSGCRMVWYCKKSCQVEDWKDSHKLLCQNLSKQHQDVKKEVRQSAAKEKSRQK